MSRNHQTTRLDPPVSVPGGETPTATCPYCDRPFTSDRARDLHLGEVHDDELDTVQCDAVEMAREAERDDLFLFHIKTVMALGVIYTAMVILYMVAIQSGFL